jgi:hypothetical protein
MFRFNVGAIEDRDIRDIISALSLFLDAVSGQRNNPCFIYLLELMRAEETRREDDEPGGVVEVMLPMGDCTGAHVWALLKFAGGVVETAARGLPNPAGQFFGQIVDQIGIASERLQSAALN